MLWFETISGQLACDIRCVIISKYNILKKEKEKKKERRKENKTNCAGASIRLSYFFSISIKRRISGFSKPRDTLTRSNSSTSSWCTTSKIFDVYSKLPARCRRSKMPYFAASSILPVACRIDRTLLIRCSSSPEFNKWISGSVYFPPSKSSHHGVASCWAFCLS